MSNNQKQQPSNNNNEPPVKRKAYAYMKYMGLAFQMGILMLIGVYVGRWLDNRFGLSRPIFLIGSVLFACIAVLYLTIKDLLRNK